MENPKSGSRNPNEEPTPTQSSVLSPQSSPILSANTLSFSYGEHRALDSVTISLLPGQLVSLLGPNGSGKSTLLKILLGSLAPSSGSVTWFDRPLNKWSPRDLARRVAYLPQSPSANPNDTVLDTLRLGRSPYLGAFGLESAADSDVIENVATLLHLTDLLNRPLDSLSGGQRQRAFLARCLTQQPQALLLDEPTTYLDLKHQVELLTLLKQLATDAKLAIVMSSHDLNLASHFSDQVLLLDKGHPAAYGPPSQVLTPQLLSRVYDLPMTSLGPYVFPNLPSGR